MNSEQPVFVQIMEIIERDIITGVYGAEDLIISTTRIAQLYNVNPATAVKAVSKLTDEGVLYKQRGVGMAVAEGAREKILRRRKEHFVNHELDRLLSEAKTLGFSLEELIGLLQSRGGNA